MSSKDRTSGQSRQASFPFPPEHKRFSDMTVTPSNAAAVRVIRKRKQWPMPVLCLLGTAQCGLTILAQAWAGEAGGRYFTASEFGALRTPARDAIAAAACVIDDADQISDEGKLLTLINLLGETGGKLLLTSHTPPPLWRVQSADLASRLKAMPVAEIGPPDEEMLKARLQAAARRYYLRLNHDVLAYIAPRLGRDYASIENFVSRLNEAVALAERAPSVHLARDVLEQGPPTRGLFEE